MRRKVFLILPTVTLTCGLILGVNKKEPTAWDALGYCIKHPLETLEVFLKAPGETTRPVYQSPAELQRENERLKEELREYKPKERRDAFQQPKQCDPKSEIDNQKQQQEKEQKVQEMRREMERDMEKKMEEMREKMREEMERKIREFTRSLK